VRQQFKENNMSNGTVTQIIGAVIDVEFDKDNIPKVYEALMVDESGTTLEVQHKMVIFVLRTTSCNLEWQCLTGGGAEVTWNGPP
jgi:F0F1-type ATP synthase beta subunit